ncbi:hypothetical protein HKX48_007168 [Thoreauomyces humboldtii]|nr:hypothetical protein HKX48_007168 [Thoreauomyces humboldtii]
MPILLRDRSPLSEQRSDTRHFSSNPNTKLEVKAENVIQSVLDDSSRFYAQAQKAEFLPSGDLVRPDVVVRDGRSGRAVYVVDAKNYGDTLPKGEVDKLLRDMRAVNAPGGGLYVAARTHVPDGLQVYASENGVNLVRDGPHAKREMKAAMGLSETSHDKGRHERASGGRPVKTDGTPDMRYAANKGTKTTSSRAFGGGPLKADGTPDMRYAANKIAVASARSSGGGPLKVDGTPDMRYAANKGRGASASKPSSRGGGSGPLKKDGTPDLRYKANRYE